MTRGVIRFDLAVLEHTEICAATMEFRAPNNTDKILGSHLSPITAAWFADSTIMLDSSPVDSSNRIYAPESTEECPIRFDVLELVKTWLADANANNGVIFTLGTYYDQSMQICSSEYATDPSRRPKLILTQAGPVSCRTSAPSQGRMQAQRDGSGIAVSFPSAQARTLALFNMQGSCLSTAGGSETQLTLDIKSTLPPGMYLLISNTQQQQQSWKILLGP